MPDAHAKVAVSPKVKIEQQLFANGTHKLRLGRCPFQKGLQRKEGVNAKDGQLILTEEHPDKTHQMLTHNMGNIELIFEKLLQAREKASHATNCKGARVQLAPLAHFVGERRIRDIVNLDRVGRR
jgi:hypothetical protein